jgi:hypothetical protein
VVCVFARKTSEPFASLVKQIDATLEEKKGFRSLVVLMPRDGENAADDLRNLAHDAGIRRVPLVIGESPDGPPDYHIAKEADVTVLMWIQSAVKVNRAYKGELTDKNISDIVADISKLRND